MGKRVNDGRTRVERGSDREFKVTRLFEAPARIVFDAWTRAALFKLWWAPESSPLPLLSCEMDARTGGLYRLAFGFDAAKPMEFFGKYLEVTPPSRLVWTNEEGDNSAVTTVTFEEEDGKTKLVLRELYPSKESLDESFAGMEDAMPEQFQQLDELLLTLNAKT